MVEGQVFTLGFQYLSHLHKVSLMKLPEQIFTPIFSNQSNKKFIKEQTITRTGHGNKKVELSILTIVNIKVYEVTGVDNRLNGIC